MPTQRDADVPNQRVAEQALPAEYALPVGEEFGTGEGRRTSGYVVVMLPP